MGIRRLFRPLARYAFSDRTRVAVKFDLVRLRARLFGPRRILSPSSKRMHLGSGATYLPGWVNVDIAGADVNVDLTARPLPFATDFFEAVVSQHLIEHLDFESEVFPVLRELLRVLQPGGELWLSTPDMEKLCRLYLQTGGTGLYEYIRDRDPLSLPAEAPPAFALNTAFFQRGLHKNLFDFTLLTWVLEKAGFAEITRVGEQDLLDRFPGFPPRNDEVEVLAIRCRKPLRREGGTA